MTLVLLANVTCWEVVRMTTLDGPLYGIFIALYELQFTTLIEIRIRNMFDFFFYVGFFFLITQI